MLPSGSTEVQLLRYQYSDHLSTATLELDSLAQVISYEEYYPYGSTSFQSGRTGAEVSLKRYRYIGKERDEETGFYYMGARYYVPWLCRWVAVDPMESKFTPQAPYVYCSNNPIGRVDENGMEDKGKGYQGIHLYELEERKGNVPTDTHEEVNSFRPYKSFDANGFHFVPSYNNKGEFDHYTAYIYHREIMIGGLHVEAVPIYLIGKDDIEKFKKNIWLYSVETAAYYDGGNLTHMKESTIQGLLGNNKAEAKALFHETVDKIKDPYLWVGFADAFIRTNKVSLSSKVTTSAAKVAEGRVSNLPTQIHHFATNKHSVFTKQMSAIAEKYGLDLNGAWNKESMPHLGRHPNEYHKFVLQGMERASMEAGGNQAKFLQLFDKYVKQPVLKNPNLLRKSGWKNE